PPSVPASLSTRRCQAEASRCTEPAGVALGEAPRAWGSAFVRGAPRMSGPLSANTGLVLTDGNSIIDRKQTRCEKDKRILKLGGAAGILPPRYQQRQQGRSLVRTE